MEECRKTHLAWLRARTKLQLQANWLLVDALAEALVEQQTMSGKDVRRLLRETRGRILEERRVSYQAD